MTVKSALVLAGEDDPVCPLPVIEELASQLPANTTRLVRVTCSALAWASSECNFWSTGMRPGDNHPGHGGVRVVSTASTNANYGRPQKSDRKIGF
jgi:hypothetical protein